MPIIEKIISVTAPYNCLACGREGRLVCSWCQPDFAPALPPRCYMCNCLSSEFRVCKNCRSKSRLNHTWVSTEYKDGPKTLVGKLKFSRARAAAKTIAEFMYDTVDYLPPNTLLMPVPTATSRVRQRGYDQSVLITKELAQKFGLPYVLALNRLGQRRQLGKNRQQRLEQLSGVFRVTSKKLIAGANIVLVDDVITTGATLETAAKTLRAAGAKHVDALVFAQTPKL